MEFFADSTKNLEYADPPYHTSKDNNLKRRKPTSGQQALESSIKFKPTSNRKVGYDIETSEFVVFDNTERHIYHGHVRSWSELDVRMQNALIQQGIVNRIGEYVLIKDVRIPVGLTSANPYLGVGNSTQFFTNKNLNMLRLNNEYTLENLYELNMPRNQYRY